jgi:hypothetical protein
MARTKVNLRTAPGRNEPHPFPVPVDGERRVSREKYGRHRYYKIVDPQVAQILESLLVMAPPGPVRSLREHDEMKAIRFARTCYDHLAGHVGVSVTDSLMRMGAIHDADGDFALTRYGEQFFTELGIDLPSAKKKRRMFCRKCLDWSERRYHLAHWGTPCWRNCLNTGGLRETRAIGRYM